MNGLEILDGIDGFLESLSEKLIGETADFYAVKLTGKTISFGGKRLFKTAAAAKGQFTNAVQNILRHAEYTNVYN